jgi:arginyl-tRNA synthetase
MRDFDPLQLLAQRFRAAIAAAVPGAVDADPMITATKNPALGDFQSNAAMGLAKRGGAGKNPREIAAAIVEKLDIADIAEPVTAGSIAGPGFINIRLRSDALSDLLRGLDTPALGIPAPAAGEKQTVVVDLCGVNLAKQMHVGHLRSTVIGDTLARTLSRLGHDVIRQNHVGDWGLPIAMVTDKVMRLADAGKLNLRTLKLDDLDRLYKAAQADCAADARGLAAAQKFGLGPKALAELEEQVGGAREADARARQTLLALQAHEPKVFAVWQRIAEITMQACLETVARLNAVVLPEHSAGESTYATELPGVVDDLLKRGIAEVDQGAVVIRLEAEGIAEPCIIRKSDGGYLYATTDMAAVRRRVQKLGADRVVYTVDARQSLHFKQVFAAATKAGYADRAVTQSRGDGVTQSGAVTQSRSDGVTQGGGKTGDTARKGGATRTASLEHAAFGTILGEDGRPFKTRTGESVKLTDLIDEAVARADAQVAARSAELSAEQRRPIAEAVGIAALRYADLSPDRVKDYVFSFDRMVSFEGNTGPYLLYALARVRSIFRKAAERGAGEAWRTAALDVREPAEKALALALLRYPAAVRAVGESLEPHRLCQYLFELATAFSGFFESCPVLQGEASVRDSRLRLCDLTGRVLGDGLTVLGIPLVERM